MFLTLRLTRFRKIMVLRSIPRGWTIWRCIPRSWLKSPPFAISMAVRQGRLLVAVLALVIGMGAARLTAGLIGGVRLGPARRARGRSRAHAERAPAMACKAPSRWGDPLDSRLHCGEGPAVAF